ncbi:unnamed protein product [Hymenolepis diminuta]|uniref:Uncharacterized protein n=1 Tax=Hymenolepis diminuta TaxID=6216 RepID=A0A564ZAC6_HYMDI|nr:unnamed protein product [Hymenolepis diminuta]
MSLCPYDSNPYLSCLHEFIDSLKLYKLSLYFHSHAHAQARLSCTGSYASTTSPLPLSSLLLSRILIVIC